MLHLLARGRSAAQLAERLAAQRAGLPQRTVALDYGTAVALPDAALAPGAWVFLDLDRLDDDSAYAVMQLRARLGRRPGVSCWNHPTRTLHRFELFRTLHEAGVARGDVWRLEDRRPPRRWPVFLHDETQPLLALPHLLDGPEALEAALQRLTREARYRPSMLIREAPGATADAGPPISICFVRGRSFLGRADRVRLVRIGVPVGLARILADARIVVGSLLLLPTPTGPMILDAGTDPILFAAGPEPGAAADALLALDGG